MLPSAPPGSGGDTGGIERAVHPADLHAAARESERTLGCGRAGSHSAAGLVPQVCGDPGRNRGPGLSSPVRSGERLFGIAEKFGTSMRAILLENGLSSPAQICAGMSLRVPCPGAGFLVYAYHMGDTPEGVAARFGMRVAELLRWNRVEGGIYPGMQLVVRAGGATEGEAGAE